jgi:hypothetical protein
MHSAQVMRTDAQCMRDVRLAGDARVMHKLHLSYFAAMAAAQYT